MKVLEALGLGGRVPTWLVASMVLGAFFGAVALPLLTYTTTLAVFGLAHVLSEMRYVHRRFGSTLHRRLALALVALLVCVVGLRAATLTGVMSVSSARMGELGVVIMLATLVLPTLWDRGRASFGAGVLVCLGLVVGVALSPIHTLMLLAVLHNATPIGFLVEAARPERRAVVAAGAGALFVGMPLVIATGVPAAALGAAGLAAPEFSLLPTGPLGAHLGAYLPRAWHGHSWAHHAFGAIVFAQCMHYAVVIHVLPRLLPEHDGEHEAGGQRAWFLGMLGAAAALLVLFWFDFGQARRIYGVAAAVHAWVEVPILLLALTALSPSGSKDARVIEREAHAEAHGVRGEARGERPAPPE